MINTGLYLGIDLGNNYSYAAFIKNGDLEMVYFGSQMNSVASSVTFNPNEKEEVIIGDVVKYSMKNIAGLAYDSKKLMGLSYDELDPEEIKKYPFKLTTNSQRRIYYELQYNKRKIHITPTEISAEILKFLKKTALPQMSHKNNENKSILAVITVPTYYKLNQREAILGSAKLAEINVLQLINEPTAAVISYLNTNEINKKNCNILVFDFGGSSLDVSIINKEDKYINMKSTFSDNHLGGKEITNCFVNYCENLIEKEINRKIFNNDKNNIKYRMRLMKECENVKKLLSVNEDEKISVEFGNDIEWEKEIKRTEFENDICKEIFNNKIVKVVNKSMEMSGLKEDEIDYVIFVGGSSRIPKVQEIIKNKFKNAEICKSVNCEEAIATGATIYSKIVQTPETDRKFIIKDILNHSIGVELNSALIKGLMKPIFKKNTSLPCETVEIFNVKKKRANIKIYEGEGKFVEDNRCLGSLMFDLKPDQTQAKVKFCVDNNGVLHIEVENGEGKFMKDFSF